MKSLRELIDESLNEEETPKNQQKKKYFDDLHKALREFSKFESKLQDFQQMFFSIYQKIQGDNIYKTETLNVYKIITDIGKRELIDSYKKLENIKTKLNNDNELKDFYYKG